MYLLGYDIGSSSIKAAIVDAQNGETIAIAQYPEVEMTIYSPQLGWAEQDPNSWWENIIHVTKNIIQKNSVDPNDIGSIGISYQMHGLVIVDKNQEVLRPAIIWCDSRAVDIGNEAFEQIGKRNCLNHLLNSPGNFTASKLKWVQENEPQIYEKVDKVLLPGDFIAMKMTGEAQTTVSGLSEGVFWDFQSNTISDQLMDHYSFDSSIIPNQVETFSRQGVLTDSAAKVLGLKQGIVVGYRAGDQPNNALSLNVLNPGEMAATGGTSGVVYGVYDQPIFDQLSRINSFAHVNHSTQDPRIGVLLCVNGAGILYSWMRQMLDSSELSYYQIEKLIESIPVNSDGLKIIPFGNGSERILENKNPGASIHNLQFNRHGKAHLYRASLEGIAFSFVYGVEIMREMGLEVNVMKVGNDNLFQSKTFSETIANILECEIEMMDTTGAVGAAKGGGVGAGFYNSISEAFTNQKPEIVYKGNSKMKALKDGYTDWKVQLEQTNQAV